RKRLPAGKLHTERAVPGRHTCFLRPRRRRFPRIPVCPAPATSLSRSLTRDRHPPATFLTGWELIVSPPRSLEYSGDPDEIWRGHVLDGHGRQVLDPSPADAETMVSRKATRLKRLPLRGDCWQLDVRPVEVEPGAGKVVRRWLIAIVSEADAAAVLV